MIDTLKIAILLTKGQYKRISEAALNHSEWQWARFNPHEGELKLQRIRGLAEADQESYHRELMYDLEPEWKKGSRLIIEFSLPKFWYGHNIHLLYNWFQVLQQLKSLLENQFNLRRMPLPDPVSWELLRADVCYAWRFPSQEHAQAYLDSLKHLKFPYKQPVMRKTSIFFPGKTYSVKLYLKLPEFEQHDLRELLKQKASLEWINHLQVLANGVLRFEVTCRKRYLAWRGLRTVGHLVENKAHVIWDKACWSFTDETRAIFLLCLVNHLSEQGDDRAQLLWNSLQCGQVNNLESGTHLTLPAGTHGFVTPSGKQEVFEHEGGGFRAYQHGQPLSIVQEMIKKFVGEGEMHSDNQVQQMLLAKYKPNKAARLTAFWVYCQRFGLERAKEVFGKNPFYQAKADLKAVGINLVERPENVVFLEDDFWRNYRMKAPSEYTSNAHDDFRDSTNLLNLPARAN